ncbi:MAG TPA: hypothetical protein VK324_08905 [Tepidisphaeraceae bacterium]|nr:hypothetical protein [Tepidisphaeraceae bacterium]
MTNHYASSLCALCLCGSVFFAGCSSEAKPADRSDRALRDPMGYRPDFDESDISGGDLGNLDKDGFKRDVDHVFNP